MSINIKRIFAFLFSLVFLLGVNSPVQATPQFQGVVSCNYDADGVDSIAFRVMDGNSEELINAGVDHIIYRIIPNQGKDLTSDPLMLLPYDYVDFEFENLINQRYKCQVSGISQGVQGSWQDIGIVEGSVEDRNSEPDCEFGYEYSSLYSNDGETEIDWRQKCRLMEWSYRYKNDGFSKYFSISMSPDVKSTSSSRIHIYCDKKKIEVYVWVPNADSFGWSGTAQVKFDKGGAKNIAYFLQKDFDGIALKDPKGFMINLVKAKSKFAFKVPTVDGYETMIYPRSDILKYRNIFSKGGCKF